VVSAFRLIIEKAREWRDSLYVLDGDIHKAYDNFEYELAIKGLRSKGVHRMLIAALMREIMQVESTVAINQQATSNPILRTRSLMQGGAADPAIFNCGLDYIAIKFRKKCRRNGWGFQMGTKWIDILLYADNSKCSE
jgi:hypothetical protein